MQTQIHVIFVSCCLNCTLYCSLENNREYSQRICDMHLRILQMWNSTHAPGFVLLFSASVMAFSTCKFNPLSLAVCMGCIILRLAFRSGRCSDTVFILMFQQLDWKTRKTKIRQSCLMTNYVLLSCRMSVKNSRLMLFNLVSRKHGVKIITIVHCNNKSNYIMKTLP